jgi:hypothetical protein
LKSLEEETWRRKPMTIRPELLDELLKDYPTSQDLFKALQEYPYHHPLAKELKDLGFSDDEIDHYENEYHIGRTIVAVKAPGREEEALAILRTNGGHN